MKIEKNEIDIKYKSITIEGNFKEFVVFDFDFEISDFLDEVKIKTKIEGNFSYEESDIGYDNEVNVDNVKIVEILINERNIIFEQDDIFEIEDIIKEVATERALVNIEKNNEIEIDFSDVEETEEVYEIVKENIEVLIKKTKKGVK